MSEVYKNQTFKKCTASSAWKPSPIWMSAWSGLLRRSLILTMFPYMEKRLKSLSSSILWNKGLYMETEVERQLKIIRIRKRIAYIRIQIGDKDCTPVICPAYSRRQTSSKGSRNGCCIGHLDFTKKQKCLIMCMFGAKLAQILK